MVKFRMRVVFVSRFFWVKLKNVFVFFCGLNFGGRVVSSISIFKFGVGVFTVCSCGTYIFSVFRGEFWFLVEGSDRIGVEGWLL